MDMLEYVRRNISTITNAPSCEDLTSLLQKCPDDARQAFARHLIFACDLRTDGPVERTNPTRDTSLLFYITSTGVEDSALRLLVKLVATDEDILFYIVREHDFLWQVVNNGWFRIVDWLVFSLDFTFEKNHAEYISRLWWGAWSSTRSATSTPRRTLLREALSRLSAVYERERIVRYVKTALVHVSGNELFSLCDDYILTESDFDATMVKHLRSTANATIRRRVTKCLCDKATEKGDDKYIVRLVRAEIGFEDEYDLVKSLLEDAFENPWIPTERHVKLRKAAYAMGTLSEINPARFDMRLRHVYKPYLDGLQDERNLDKIHFELMLSRALGRKPDQPELESSSEDCTSLTTDSEGASSEETTTAPSPPSPEVQFPNFRRKTEDPPPLERKLGAGHDAGFEALRKNAKRKLF